MSKLSQHRRSAANAAAGRATLTRVLDRIAVGVAVALVALPVGVAVVLAASHLLGYSPL